MRACSHAYGTGRGQVLWHVSTHETYAVAVLTKPTGSHEIWVTTISDRGRIRHREADPPSRRSPGPPHEPVAETPES